MLLIAGPAALTPAKREALLRKAKVLDPQLEWLDAIYFHLVQPTTADAEKALSSSGSRERSVLDALLHYGDYTALPDTAGLVESGDARVLYITPVPGAISPWSSKATDISRICTLDGVVERLERGIAYIFSATPSDALLASLKPLIHDRMTQVILSSPPTPSSVFDHAKPAPLRTVSLGSTTEPNFEDARARLAAANKTLGLALAAEEMDYLVNAFIAGPEPIGRDPTDTELFMFAQVNSEHCRHKIFNAQWTLDGVVQENSLFQMIRNTERLNGKGTISAYSDNAAVIEGSTAPRFTASSSSKLPHAYSAAVEEMPFLIKVETHNHPTAVSPFPGAATGSGGEIRDEGAVGRGSKPKAGLAGFTTSNLLIPGAEQPWETDFGRPGHIASSLDIMIEGPLGASAFNNEFGRPALGGYFRTFAERIPVAVPRHSSSDPSTSTATEVRGYHKPIMVAGGLGNVHPSFSLKSKISVGAKLIVLGGPGMLIGLGGGAASSQTSGASSADLDFASVQRENPEMQRRCQQVIDGCVNYPDGDNPIQSIHDVGAGGLSNALPELVHDSDLGARFELRDVLVDDPGMSPMEIWCNESQERYVLAVHPDRLPDFEAIAKRERCPYSVVGQATEEQELVVTDRLLGGEPIHLEMATLFGRTPRLHRNDVALVRHVPPFDTSLTSYLPQLSPSDRVKQAVDRVLHLPSVASKAFLITIGDRSITGLVTRDQMVGPWQVPVADVAVTRTSYGFDVRTGEAMAMGERTPLALLSPAASARMAVAESLLNIAAASIDDLTRVKLSANWMCAAGHPGEGAALYEAVMAIGMDLCPALGVGIPVGKDSMSMSMKWKDEGEDKQVTAPLSLIVTAFAPVRDVEQTWTPQLRTDIDEPTVLLFFDLAVGKQRLGGSALAQVFKTIGHEAPDVEDAQVLRSFFLGCQALRADATQRELVLAYHDRSDGGLFTTIAEMCFAGRTGVDINLDGIVPSGADPLAALFNEELGAVLQIRASDEEAVRAAFVSVGLPGSSIHAIGQLTQKRSESVRFLLGGSEYFVAARASLQAAWSETSFQMQSLRDDPQAAKEEFDTIASDSRRGLFFDLPFPVRPSSFPRAENAPRVAILREQGVNGHVEMAWAFSAAGFEAVDVHMSDLLSGRVRLEEFRGIAACGGFSYGDVLGAGNGWAKSILLHADTRSQFEAFFRRPETFTLGVCNGCQLLSHLKEIIPGAEAWPEMKQNQAQRFEARTCMVEVVPGPTTEKSVFLRHMGGAKLPCPIAHGEGRAFWEQTGQQQAFESSPLTALRYIDDSGAPAKTYPANPNGSPAGLAGFHSLDGRILALMPHPERAVTRESNSWYPKEGAAEWNGIGPWFELFRSVREWCEESAIKL